MTLKTFIGLMARLRLEVSNSDPSKAQGYEVIISNDGALYEFDIEKGISYGRDEIFQDGCVVIPIKRKEVE